MPPRAGSHKPKNVKSYKRQPQSGKAKPKKTAKTSSGVKAGTRYLTRRQFERVRPFGDYDKYIAFLAKRAGMSKQEIVRFAQGVDPQTFHELLQASKQRLSEQEKRYAAQIRQGFIRAGHKDMAKYANLFVLAGRKAGLDPRFIAALGAQESAWGTATPSNAPYNYWGWSVNTGQSHSSISNPFQNPKSAFSYFGTQLGKKYGSAKTAFDSVWAPYAADPSHEAQVASILKNYFRGNPMNIRFGA